MICKLKKAIYDLKQSPRALFDKFSRIIYEVDFQKCYSNRLVFIRKSSSGTVILVTYVDDILLTGVILMVLRKLNSILKLNL